MITDHTMMREIETKKFVRDYGLRVEMWRRIPRFLQSFLTWLTARPYPGQQLKRRTPAFIIYTASIQLLFGILSSVFGQNVGHSFGYAVVLVGLMITAGALGTFQVVVFHHCSHGTVFRSRQLNIKVGRFLSGLLLFMVFDEYKREHMLHHSRRALSHEDEFTRFIFDICEFNPFQSRRSQWLHLLLILSSPIFHGNFFWLRLSRSWGATKITDNLLPFVCWVSLFAIAASIGQTVHLFFAVAIPLTFLLQITTVLRTLCEHRFPDEQMASGRGQEFLCKSTSGVFLGSLPPVRSATSFSGFFEWSVWWMEMICWHLPIRVVVLIGDSPCHDFHHRHPTSADWPNYISARQHDIDVGHPGYSYKYLETWGLIATIDSNLASLRNMRQTNVGDRLSSIRL